MTVQGGAQRALWVLNARAVLQVVERLGPLGRPEIVRATGLSKTTVTQTLQSLVAQGVVAEAGLDTSRRGPAATLFEIPGDCSAALGVDVGRHRVTAAVSDMRGAELARVAVRIGDGEALAEAVVRAARGCADEAGVDLRDVGQAVVGVRAIVGRDHRTVRLPAPGLPGGAAGERGLALVEALEEQLPVPVRLENDVNLATVAEMHEGVGRDVADFVLLGHGDGLGAGLVIGGRLHRGVAGGAGEVGYLPGPGTTPGQPVMTGSELPGLAEAAGLPPSPAEVFALARAGDPRGRAVLERVAERLALVVASVALVVEPELVVLGGPFSDEALLEPVRAVLRRDAAPLVIPLSLSGVAADPVLRGALWEARLRARDAVFTAAVAADPPGRP
ncbi:ROK family transcriptional regulator [Streptomyces sp. NPDC051940]|uniref:ROK family transcriptional regulator n=1 Tax=Streptomyces sp. NPDC051940 TaxID=3155675 RepID=UPI0034436CE2